MNVIVDASVAAKWFLEEEFADDARRIFSEDNRLHVPDFFLLEMDSVLCKWTRRGVIADSEGQEVRSDIAKLPIQIYPAGGLRDFAYDLANLTGCGFYDCLYLALTILLDGRMVTADRRFYNGLSDSTLAEHILWVEDIP